jgi:hypothetical protein
MLIVSLFIRLMFSSACKKNIESLLSCVLNRALDERTQVDIAVAAQSG